MAPPYTSMSDRDPNFPLGLAIGPSKAASYVSIEDKYADRINPTAGTDADEWDQERSIQTHGIAGRVWDASYPIIPYLTRSGPASNYTFDPPCSIFSKDGGDNHVDRVVLLELGSGQSVASLHLIDQLHQLAIERIVRDSGSDGCKGGSSTGNAVLLTDLENVTDLCNRNVEAWRRQVGKLIARDASRSDYDGEKSELERSRGECSQAIGPEIEVWALPWGAKAPLSPEGGLLRSMTEKGGLTHVLMVDLVYFPFLYPGLMRTLLHITMPPFARAGQLVEVIFSYKSRSLEFEEPFFVALSRYFTMVPVLSKPNGRSVSTSHDTSASASFAPHGRDDDVHIYLLQRRAETLVEAWTVPEGDEEIMQRGGVSVGDQGDRGWGWLEEQLGAIEWEG